MTKQITIKRRRFGDGDSSYAALRQQGIDVIQALSGQRWTDFNHHDPGVTILEQLCYALTDVCYQQNFDTADYLTDPDGTIDFDALALYSPTEVLPVRPTTISDLRRAILDAVPDIDNVWLRPVRDGRMRGLLDIAILTEEGADEYQQQRAAAEVEKAYRRFRNLCEDAGVISFVNTVSCDFRADIDISSHRTPAAVLADIYTRVVNCVSPSPEITPYSALRQTKPLEALLTGPFTASGVIAEGPFAPDARELHMSDIISAVRKNDDVVATAEIALLIDGIPHHGIVPSLGAGTVYQIALPRSDADIGVRLYRNGKHLPVTYDALMPELEKRRASRRRSLDPEKGHALDTLPIGTHREVGMTSSIQELFPLTYGLGRFGLPKRVSRARKAKAAQLKGYLLIFDQLMANRLGTLRNIRQLMSVRRHRKRSYGSRPLDGRTVAGVNGLWRQDVPVASMAEIVEQQDDYIDRQGRMLDYQLAMYGERFMQKSLRHFFYYNTPGEDGETVLRNKRRLLRRVASLNRDRAAGVGFTAEGHTFSGVQMKASVLLGIESTSPWTTDTLRNSQINLIEDGAFDTERRSASTFHPMGIDVAAAHNGILVEMPYRSLEKTGKKTIQKLTGSFRFPNRLGRRVFRDGVLADRYFIMPMPGKTGCRLMLRVSGEAEDRNTNERTRDSWWEINTFENGEDAAIFGNTLRNTFVSLNSGSEGFHVVEHLLLRMMNENESEMDANFCAFKVSILLPTWTSRFYDSQFRRLAEETIRKTVPAHIHPTFMWLDFDEMCLFEDHFRKWQQLKADGPAVYPSVDVLSLTIKSFLLKKGVGLKSWEGGQEE